MAYDTIVEEVKGLSEENQTEVLEFIYFLKYRKGKGGVSAGKKATKRIRRKENILGGKLIYMSDDFDETPDCFKEYM